MAEARSHSGGLRVWHWLNAITVLALLGTYFLREYIGSQTRFIAQRLRDTGLTFDDAVVKEIRGEIVDQLWVWHINLGYFLTALFAMRVILFFTDRTNPFTECWRSFCAARQHFDFRNVHSVLVKASYLAFYCLLLFMIGSGLTLTFGDGLGIREATLDLAKESHETVMWFFAIFVVAHIAGVFIAENSGDPGIVSAMINGKNRD